MVPMESIHAEWVPFAVTTHQIARTPNGVLDIWWVVSVFRATTDLCQITYTSNF